MGKFSTSTRKQNYSSYRAFRRKLSFGFFCLFFGNHYEFSDAL